MKLKKSAVDGLIMELVMCDRHTMTPPLPLPGNSMLDAEPIMRNKATTVAAAAAVVWCGQLKSTKQKCVSVL